MSTINLESFFKEKNFKKSKNMVVFVQSYPNLINTLYLINNSFLYEKTTVCVIKNINLYKFLDSRKSLFKNEINILFIDDDDVSFKSIYHFFSSFTNLKIKIKRSLNKLQFINSDIFFFSKAFTTLGFYLIKNLKKYNQLVHFPDPGCDVYQLSDSKPNGLKQAILLLVYKLLYGKELVFGNAGRKLNTNYFFKISDSYFYKNVNLSLTIEDRKNLQTDFTLDSFAINNLNKFSVVYFDKDMLRDNLCDKSLYKNELTNIFKILEKYINKEDLAKKYKPGRTTDLNKKIINYGFLVDDFIPAEFLINSNVKVYLGMTSIAMANIESGNIISLVNLVTYLDPIKKQRSIDNLEKRKKTTVYYPNTLVEFENLLVKFFKN
tara:strand:+ start:10091 stop:11224 length:1134 start_codon:yes stop_codon:yes gene_type:complete